MTSVIPKLDFHSITQFIITHLSSANLFRKSTSAKSASPISFGSNSSFWHAVLSQHVNAFLCVELSNFQLCDWFPRSPGLYHTDDGLYQRKNAQKNLVNEAGILHYLPTGKSNMLAGGLGAVRFRPINLENIDYWMCTATSDNYCHSGIPLAIPQNIFSSFNILELASYRISGELRYLPQFLDSHFRHYTRIPQLYLQVSEIKRISSASHPIIITPMVFFESKETKPNYNVTYVQCFSSNNNEYDQAAEWIDQYVKRYGSKIITNFDQQRPIFEDAPFSLQAIMGNRFDSNYIETLHIYNAELIKPSINKIFTEKNNMTTSISVTLGDGTIIHGHVVVANSISDSFNHANNSNSTNEIKETLKQLAVAVGKLVEGFDQESAAETARDLETLTKEATSINPRKKWWQLSMDGITEAAEKTVALGKPVLEILTKLDSLIFPHN